MDTLTLGLFWYVVFLFSTTLHEAAHAWCAQRGGDLTGYHAGQVTLDPRPHVRREFFGTVVVPVASYLLGGWMIGWASTPYDPAWADRYPRRAAIMSLAGPVANLGLMLVAALVIRLGVLAGIFHPPDTISFTHVVGAPAHGLWGGVATLISIMFMLNLILFVFNLFPIPPLDGSQAVGLLLPPDMARRWQTFLHQPALAYLGLFLAWKVFGAFLEPIRLLAVNLLYPGSGYR